MTVNQRMLRRIDQGEQVESADGVVGGNLDLKTLSAGL